MLGVHWRVWVGVESSLRLSRHTDHTDLRAWGSGVKKMMRDEARREARRGGLWGGML